MPHRLSIPRSQKLSKVKGHYLNISNWKLVLLWLNLKQKLPNLASAWLSWALLSPSLAHSCFLFRSCVGARKLLWDLLCIMIKNCCFLALFSFLAVMQLQLYNLLMIEVQNLFRKCLLQYKCAVQGSRSTLFLQHIFTAYERISLLFYVLLVCGSVGGILVILMSHPTL